MDYQLGYPCFSDHVEQPRKVYFQEENKYADTTSIKDIEMSKLKTIAINESGDVYTWGIDYDGKTFMEQPQKVKVDFEKDIKTSEVVLSQAEWSTLSKVAKNAVQYYAKTNEDADTVTLSAKAHRKSGNAFEIAPEYFLTKIAVHKAACSNKHALLVILSD